MSDLEKEQLLDTRVKVNSIINRLDYNKSVYFVLPMVGLDSKYFSLINSYLGDNLNKPNYNFNKIFANIKYNDEKLRANPFYNTEYALPDRTWMYVFNIPEFFENDYVLFCDGKYSQFSADYKNQITKYLQKPVQDSHIFKIIHKTADRKEYIENLVGQKLLDTEEVCSIPNLDKEIYNG
jgi:hypothetical protein